MKRENNVFYKENTYTHAHAKGKHVRLVGWSIFLRISIFSIMNFSEKIKCKGKKFSIAIAKIAKVDRFLNNG